MYLYNKLVLTFPRDLISSPHPSPPQDLFGYSAKVLVGYLSLSLVGLKDSHLYQLDMIVVISLIRLFSFLESRIDRYLLTLCTRTYPPTCLSMYPFLPRSLKVHYSGLQVISHKFHVAVAESFDLCKTKVWWVSTWGPFHSKCNICTIGTAQEKWTYKTYFLIQGNIRSGFGESHKW